MAAVFPRFSAKKPKDIHGAKTFKNAARISATAAGSDTAREGDSKEAAALFFMGEKPVFARFPGCPVPCYYSVSMV